MEKLVACFSICSVIIWSTASIVQDPYPSKAVRDKRWSNQPKWIKPCGDDDRISQLEHLEQLSDKTLLQNVVTQVKTALNFNLGFRDDYIKRTFNMDYADLHSAWKDLRYDWLPRLEQIPNMQLGGTLEKFEAPKFDAALLDSWYAFMQTYAAGLEQTTWDQQDNDLGFYKQFQETEYLLRSILCEIRVAQVARAVSPRQNVGREVMPAQYRNMSSNESFRNQRDWLIFRDYMNALEYIVQASEYLMKSL